MTVEPASDELLVEIEDNTFDWDWTPLDPRAFTRTDVCVGHIAALIARIRQDNATIKRLTRERDEARAALLLISEGHQMYPRKMQDIARAALKGDKP